MFSEYYSDVIMSMMASQITSPTLVYSTVYSGADQRKHQSSASLAFVMGIHRWPVNSPHKGPVTRKMFPSDDVIMVSSPVLLLAFLCKHVCNTRVLSIIVILGDVWYSVKEKKPVRVNICVLSNRQGPYFILLSVQRRAEIERVWRQTNTEVDYLRKL